MVPMGGYKGAGIALIVEIMAAAMTGANFALDASSFADNKGDSPGTGQFFLAMDPTAFGGEDFPQRLEYLLGAISEQEGARLPGQGRLRARERTAVEGVAIAEDLLAKIKGYTG